MKTESCLPKLPYFAEILLQMLCGAIKGDLFRNILVFVCLTTVLAFVFTVETIILVLCILRKQWLAFLKGIRDKKHSKVCFCHKH